MTSKQQELIRARIERLRAEYPWKESYELSAVVCAELGIDEVKDAEAFRIIDAMCAGYEDLSFITNNKSASDATLAISPDSPGSAKPKSAPTAPQPLTREEGAPPQSSDRYGAYDPSYALRAHLNRNRRATESYFKDKEAEEARRQATQQEQEKIEQIAYNAHLELTGGIPVGEIGNLSSLQRREARNSRIALAEAEAGARKTEILVRARQTISANIHSEVNKIGAALLAYIVISLLMSAALGIYAILIAGWSLDELYAFTTNPRSMALIAGAVTLLGLAVPFIVYILASGMPLSELLPLRTLRKGELAPMVWIGLGFVTLQGLVYNYINYPAQVRGAHYDFTAVSFGTSVPDMALTYLFLCLVPAFIECFVFNGAILQTLRRKGGDGFALVLSALLYALVLSDFVDYTGAFISALVLGYLVIFSGSLVPALAVRLVERSLFFAVTYLGFSSSGARWVHYIDCGISIACLIAALIAIKIMLGRFPDFFMIKKSDPCLTLGEKMKIAFKTGSLVILLIGSLLFSIMQFFELDGILSLAQRLMYGAA